MDKDEILRRAQKEDDEMVVQVRDKSMRYTYLALVLSAAVFAFVRGLQGQPIMDLCATVSFSVFAGTLYRFVRTKDRWELGIAIMMLVVGIVSTVRFFMGH